jgi:hypothetical protein
VLTAVIRHYGERPAADSFHGILISVSYGDGMRRTVVALLFVLVAAGCGSDDNATAKLPQGSETVELDPADFTTVIDNPYWPMAPGSRWVYRETGENGELKVVVTVTDRKKVVDGIDAVVVHDVVTEDGEVIEDTFDWYAQDAQGNV